MADYAEETTRYTDIFSKILAGKSVVLRTGIASAAKLAADLSQHERSVVIVAASRDETVQVGELIRLFSPELSSGQKQHESGNVIVFSPFSDKRPSIEIESRRMAALHAVRYARNCCAVLPAEWLLIRLMSVHFFDDRTEYFEKGSECSPDLLLEQAVEWGYVRTNMVSGAGEIARRGDIVDIMPPGSLSPVRLEFWGDTLESIRIFNAATQRSEKELQHLRMIPIRSFSPQSRKVVHFWENMAAQNRLTGNELFALKSLLERNSSLLFPGCCHETTSFIEDWVPKDAIWILPEDTVLHEALTQARNKFEAILEGENRSDRQPSRMALRREEDVSAFVSERTSARIVAFDVGQTDKSMELKEVTLHRFEDLFPLPEDRDRPWKTLIAGLRRWQKENLQVILAFSSARSRSKFLDMAAQENIVLHGRYRNERGIFALEASLSGGCRLIWNRTLILNEQMLQPNQNRGGTRAVSGAFRGLDRHEDLRPGDLLVHRDYGIGRFCGLQHMTLGGIPNDFLVLSYSGDDRLYLPADRMNLIQKFKGGSDAEAELDKLGGSSWQAGRDKAKKAIEKIAEDLVEMYAWRKAGKGFSYGPIGDLYREFEASFVFEETPDQARAIQDVLTDMEKPQPMDRLVCGDVGFGKTEVAMRAAFRAASEGRQVVLLCPTTVLAEQHYRTFRSRMSGFAVEVGVLSRFISPVKQKEVLRNVAHGKIDVLIGTHRLLSDDVSIPNLGLLILDEEQRFGVRHKERLKQIRRGVDVLTLSATPIPRTLQLSMSGVRELSVIETAPPERKPVATAVMERNESDLRSVVQRELQRGGQIFWVYNRVRGIEAEADYVRKLAPDAKIGIAHGQLTEKQLDDTMHAFWAGDLDILVCTAIVESGLDFPKANTLIVDQAQMFGLGQLYQLRGRVGRSDVQAFACFIVPDLKRMPQDTRERLRIILDLDYLGAGFQVAMEDLRLRGAGNILGESQTGHMNRIGLDMYLELLEQAVVKLKTGNNTLQLEPEIQLKVSAFIPESYIEDGRERLRWYRRLATAGSAADREEAVLELKDRFGAVPLETETLLAVTALKKTLSSLGVEKAEVGQKFVRLDWGNRKSSVSAAAMLRFLDANRCRIRLLPPSGMEVCASSDRNNIAEQLDEIRFLLEEQLLGDTIVE
ncbi:MAG: transcription-repair coupling factor [Desulfovibrionaceae bacterium]|nr:transcription-repair coupling factor [Desulfovibrionaceae bacterium]